MNKLVFMDLDDTIFQERHKSPVGADLTTGALCQEGKPLSFCTEQQRSLWTWLDEDATIIPVTARSLVGYRRVQLSFTSWAVMNFGALILNPEGEPDESWRSTVRPLLAKEQERIREIVAGLKSYIGKEKLDVRLQEVIQDEHLAYVSIKHNTHDSASLSRIKSEYFDLIDTSGYQVHLNDNYLTIGPHGIGKREAVAFLLEEKLTAQPRLTIGFGDSLTDLKFMSLCDFWMTPGRSQIDVACDPLHT